MHCLIQTDSDILNNVISDEIFLRHATLSKVISCVCKFSFVHKCSLTAEC